LRADLGAAIRFVYLRGTAELIRQRIQQRRGHYMPAALLASQFAALEEPSAALVVEITVPVAEVVAEIRRQLRC
jgi:gluconokinase